MDSALGLHIVKRTVSFYVMVSPSTHYVMYQLAKIKISNCMDDLTKLVVDTHHTLRALGVFHRICIRPANSSLPSQYQMTIATSNHDHITSASQNHKRKIYIQPIALPTDKLRTQQYNTKADKYTSSTVHQTYEDNLI
ncbi:hypothetical protein CU097_011628 [Rhizopus azygosporus]|uniref:Uncharacterized protein n=1 Tax=Rhizopus azygosporus TaxID=86630 RepID=A0A367K9N9_RHIAZ|nr:hypothetical protein CU097_011628 [Rhizopus azygosporus]